MVWDWRAARWFGTAGLIAGILIAALFQSPGIILPAMFWIVSAVVVGGYGGRHIAQAGRQGQRRSIILLGVVYSLLVIVLGGIPLAALVFIAHLSSGRPIEGIEFISVLGAMAFAILVSAGWIVLPVGAVAAWLWGDRARKTAGK